MANAQPSQLPTSIAIIGLGLLGGSLAAAFRLRYPSVKIWGFSSVHTNQEALQVQLIDTAFTYAEINTALKADLVFLCTPITHILDTLENWKKNLPSLTKPVYITDVGSTKKQICEIATYISQENKNFYFVGSHPMAGSEKRGISARDPHLFENAPWIFCAELEDPRVKIFREFLEPLGIVPLAIGPAEHDKTVAKISHLPQLLSTSLAGYFLQNLPQSPRDLDFAGRGFKDMTRISHSEFSIWEPIFSTNHENITAELSQLHQYMGWVLEEFKSRRYETFFKQGANWPLESAHLWKKNSTNQPSEIRVVCPDQPGQLAKILSPLSEHQINILDIEVLQVRENEPGTIRLVLPNRTSAERAHQLLIQNGNEAILLE